MNPNNTSVSELPFYKNPAPKLFKPEDILLVKNQCIGDFSFFYKPVQNIIPATSISAFQAYKVMISPRYQTPTMILRSIPDATAARTYKARNFDYVCFSGIFARRSESGLIRHSNLLTIDFDHIQKPHELKEDLIMNPYFDTVLAFISPSGDGLKWIIKIDLKQGNHLQWFNAVASYVKQNYRLDIDKSGKDVSRCCFLPYDPTCYLNEKYI